ncbi:MAG: hypothetical protein RL095_2092 [Verrucomicrobiota bacterium]|jgi:DNA-binding IclR family transcriptional regulator
MPSQHHVPNLERGMKILEHLNLHPAGLTQKELAVQLGYPGNSVFRITMTLLELGYLDRDPASKAFRLTRKLMSVGSASIGEYSIIEKSLEEMRLLRDLTRETVLLGSLLPTTAKGVVMEQVPGLHPFKFLFDVGSPVLLHVGAPGKCLLAFQPEKECRDLLGRIDYQVFTSRTHASAASLRKELAEVRKLGYAVDRGEWMEEMHCVGAPIFDHNRQVVAALWITGPSSRLPEKEIPRLGELIRNSCLSISRSIGYRA